jgi:hypothetical protein
MTTISVLIADQRHPQSDLRALIGEDKLELAALARRAREAVGT